MIDWQAELDALFKQTAHLIKAAELKIEVPRAPPRAIIEPVITPPAANKISSGEREEIRKRVASFKAHQQRTIREREEYAASVLVRLKATLSEQS